MAPTPPAPPTPPPPAPPGDPAPTDPPPPDDDPRAILKSVVREVLTEFKAEQLADPQRTKPRDFLRDLLGIKD